MSKKYDIVSFNNELDMLELRMNILCEHVDYFVVVESTETFSGHEKPLYFSMNLNRFKQFSDKIIHYAIRDTPVNFEDNNCDQEVLRIAATNSNVTREHLCWLKEFYQKEQIKKALENLDDEDICYISDVDEIWNYKLKLSIDDKIYKPMIKNCYINYLNVKTDETWTIDSNPFTGPIVTKYKNVKNSCLNDLRTLRKMKDRYIFIEDGGWHFNALGGIEKKIRDFKHPVYSIFYMKNRERGSRIDESDLPEYILKNREKYRYLFYNN